MLIQLFINTCKLNIWEATCHDFFKPFECCTMNVECKTMRRYTMLYLNSKGGDLVSLVAPDTSISGFC